MRRKTVYTLNLNGDYAPEITAITYPLMKYWAEKIGANFHMITERKFPEWPVTYEKLQIYELAQKTGDEWNIFLDSDAVIHPETIDWTTYIRRDTVAHNGNDMANIRWRYDKYFLRDGRNFGSCNWFTIASDWCIDLWRPLDISPKEAISNIYPTVDELNTIITPEHLIDDYALSRNIAMFGLKTTTLSDVQKQLGFENANFHWHLYTIGIEEKVAKMKELMEAWKLPAHIRNYGR